MKNSIYDLRNHLFATIEALQDPEKPMDVDRARAKVEVDFIEATGEETMSKFFVKTADINTLPGNGAGSPVPAARKALPATTSNHSGR